MRLQRVGTGFRLGAQYARAGHIVGLTDDYHAIARRIEGHRRCRGWAVRRAGLVTWELAIDATHTTGIEPFGRLIIVDIDKAGPPTKEALYVLASVRRRNVHVLWTIESVLDVSPTLLAMTNALLECRGKKYRWDFLIDGYPYTTKEQAS